jgi:hypothetical protein
MHQLSLVAASNVLRHWEHLQVGCGGQILEPMSYPIYSKMREKLVRGLVRLV